MGSLSVSERAQLISEGLEAVRLEALRRLRSQSLPTSVEQRRLVVQEDPDGTGWKTDWETVSTSSLQLDPVLVALRDETVPLRLAGFREQLEPLAEFLHASTDIGQKRPQGILPQATGPDAILARFLSPLAITYLTELQDVDLPEQALIDRIVSDFETLCDLDAIRHTHQLALGGLHITKTLGPDRGVSVRKLSPSERGRVLEEQEGGLLRPQGAMGDFVVPRSFKYFMPTVLLQITSERPRDEVNSISYLPYKLALSFYLHGFELDGVGVLVGFDEPAWAGGGYSHTPFPVTEKMTTANAHLTEADLTAVIDLAHRMPDFGPAEASRSEVVLYRVLRGCGTSDSAFLDFAIALEAALLSGDTTELAYRFSLYGALFLHADRDPADTFTKLKNIYSVRSKLVHGSLYNHQLRLNAERDAADLAKAVARKAVEEDWPDRGTLDQLALATGLPRPNEDSDLTVGS